MGGSNVYVPRHRRGRVVGPRSWSGDEERGSDARPRAGAPVIQIRSFAFMGEPTMRRLAA
jgi:hypothetical protein